MRFESLFGTLITWRMPVYAPSENATPPTRYGAATSASSFPSRLSTSDDIENAAPMTKSSEPSR